MKTLTHQTLIYDDECPLCRAYSTAFVKTGMLDAHGKMPYADARNICFIDMERAANEIALIDTKAQKTLYGIDSLLAIIGNSFPFVAKVGNLKPVHFLLTRLYRFISYNRKVIMPNAVMPQHRMQCLPEFNIRYRLLYLVCATLFTAITLYAFSGLLPKMSFGGLETEMALATGQVLFQGLFIIRKGFRDFLNYSGHLLTVSLLGSLLLLPLLIAGYYFAVGEFVAIHYFALVATIMFLEHFRRVELLGFPKMLCVTWVLYRLGFLLFIL